MITEFKLAIEEMRNPYEYEIYDFLRHKGIQVPNYHVFSSIEELNCGQDMFSDLDMYVAKVISPKIVHKSDYNAVLLGLARKQFCQTFKDLSHRFREMDFKGMMIIPMIEPGIDFIVGSSVDQTFGKIMVFGFGGIFVEILRDVTFAKPPITRTEARNMIDSLKNRELLMGVRGLPKVHYEELETFLVKFSHIIEDYGKDFAEIDINPFRYTKNGIFPLDARIFLTKLLDFTVDKGLE